MQGEIASFKHCGEMGSKSSYIDIGFKEGREGGSWREGSGDSLRF